MGPYVAASIGAVGLGFGRITLAKVGWASVLAALANLEIGAGGAFRTRSNTNSVSMWFLVDPVDTT